MDFSLAKSDFTTDTVPHSSSILKRVDKISRCFKDVVLIPMNESSGKLSRNGAALTGISSKKMNLINLKSLRKN